MRTLSYILLCPFFIISCEVKKTGFNSETDALTLNAKTLVKDGANDISEYNDALISETVLLQLEFEKIADLDSLDIPEEEFTFEAKKSIKAIQNIQENLHSIDFYGNEGEALLVAVINFAVESEAYIKLYLDYTKLMTIPDKEWTEDQINEYIDVFGPPTESYLKAFEDINLKQHVFAKKNGALVVENESFNSKVVYQNSKK
jgi:hypothetical protein